MPGMRLSVIVIARNEESALKACLTSVEWADECIVMDGGSTDRTVELARSLGARVEVAADWPGFGPQKNRVLALAQGDWVLSLDADERVTPELRAEIESVLKLEAGPSVYRMPRSSRYCGQALRHGGWWPDYVPRLFRRGSARFSDDLVHERLLFDPGVLGTLKSPLQHETYVHLEEVLEKANRYSTLGAAQAFASGERSSLLKACGHALWAFFRTYFLRKGFLDGAAGFLLAVSNAHTTFYRYAKLWLMGRGR